MKQKINISKNTLQIIKNRKIKPIPKWELVSKNWFLWVIFSLCLIILVIGFGLTVFGVSTEIINPYFWVILTMVFLGLSLTIFEKTKKAYRFEKWKIFILITCIGVVFGVFIFKFGLANKIDKKIASKLNLYRQVVPMKVSVWSNPDEGYLSGTITSILNHNNFTIEDFYGKKWKIVCDDNVEIKKRVSIKMGEMIKLLGHKKDENSFVVKEIRPWIGMKEKQ